MIDREDFPTHTLLRLAHGKASALDTDFALAITAAVREAESAAKPLLLTGSGAIFSAGVDLKRLLEADDTESAAFLDALEDCFEALFRFPLPVVAAVNGHAIAGGCVLVAACDHRIMTTGKARIGVPELLVGVPFPPAAFEIVREAFPPATHSDAFWRGKLLDPSRALEAGWIHETAEPDDVVPRATAWLEALSGIPEATQRLTKQTLRAPAIDRIVRSRAALRDDVIRTWQSQPVRDAIRTYVEKTLR